MNKNKTLLFLFLFTVMIESSFLIVLINATVQYVPVELWPTWTFTSPTNMFEYPLFTNYTFDGLEFKIRGWEQFCEVTDGSEIVTAKPYDGAQYPLNFSDESANTRWVGWATTILGNFWADEIIWADLTTETANFLMSLLENGIMTMFYESVPAGHQFIIDSSTGAGSNWANTSNSIFTVGDIRVNVIEGNASTSTTTLMVNASVSSQIHVSFYNRQFFDGKPINELGALDGVYPDEVVITDSYYREKSMYVNYTDAAIDTYLAVNPVTPMTTGLMLWSDESVSNWARKMAYGIADSENGNTFTHIPMMSNPAKIIVGGSQFAQRQWVIQGDDLAPATSNMGNLVFKWYGFADTSIKAVARITDEVIIKYYLSTNSLIVYYPETISDRSEHTGTADGFGDFLNLITSKVVWAFRDYEYIEGFYQYVNLSFDIDGEEGNAQSGGWGNRLIGTNTPKDIKYRNSAGVWASQTPAAGSWTWRSGNGIFNMLHNDDSQRQYHQCRNWDGTFSARTWQVADIRNVATNQDSGFQVNIVRVDTLSPGDTVYGNLRYIWEPNSSVPSDAHAEYYYDTWDLSGVAFIDGLVDLTDDTASTNANWDLGYGGDGNPQIFYMGPYNPINPNVFKAGFFFGGLISIFVPATIIMWKRPRGDITVKLIMVMIFGLAFLFAFMFM